MSTGSSSSLQACISYKSWKAGMERHLLVNKAFSWIHNTPLCRVPSVHLKRSMRAGIPVAYIVNNVTATWDRNVVTFRYVTTQIFRKNSLIRLFLHAWLPEKHLPSQTIYNGRENSFSDTRRLLFLSLERRIVHD